MTRVIVCGGRDFGDRALAYEALDALWVELPDLMVVHGGALGADALADAWAADRGRPVECFRADWKRHGRAAGPIRNAVMLRAGASLVVAFPGGRGTADMVGRAEIAGVPVRRVG